LIFFSFFDSEKILLSIQSNSAGGASGMRKGSEFFYRYGGVLVFGSLCLSVYYPAMQKKTQTYLELKSKVAELESLRDEAVLHRDDLLLQIQSQNDPEWCISIKMSKV
jgi:hypothetical protein